MAADTTTTARRRWRAMGSDAEVIVVAPSTVDAELLVERAVDRVEELEARWSRFRPTSEVTRMNGLAGSAVEVSADTVTLVTLAVEAWRLTGGAFDPLLLDALVAVGYDRTLDEVRSHSTTAAPRGRAAHPAGRSLFSLVGCTDIEVSGRTVRLPRGGSFDGGGIGKGLAADLVLDELLDAGALGACVNLGGDLRVAGLSPDGPTWTLGIGCPGAPDPIALVGLTRGAVATSTTLLRQWVSGGEMMHHLLDPQTGRPSDSDIVLSTVIAAEAWEAEVLAKAVLLRGSDRAFDLLVPERHAAMTVDCDGIVRTSAGFEHFVDRPLPNHVQISAGQGH